MSNLPRSYRHILSDGTRRELSAMLYKREKAMS